VQREITNAGVVVAGHVCKNRVKPSSGVVVAARVAVKRLEPRGVGLGEIGDGDDRLHGFPRIGRDGVVTSTPELDRAKGNLVTELASTLIWLRAMHKI